MSSMKISVVIPAFNAETTLPRALDSVLAQTLPAYEVIVVDDGSEDGTASVAASYEGVRLVRQENSGVSAARNRGVEQAGGDWIAFLDADDYYYPWRLEEAARALAKVPEADFITGNFEYRTAGGKLIRTSMEENALGRKLIERSEGGIAVMRRRDFREFVADHFGDTHTLTLPRETFLSLGGYDTAFRVCEDVHLLTRLCARSTCTAVVVRPLAVYVIHGQSATRRDPIDAQRQTVAAMRDVCARLDEADAGVRAGARDALASAYLDLSYALAKAGHRGQAAAGALRSCLVRPRRQALRALLGTLIKG